MGMNVFAAVGFRVAVEQVAHAIEQATCPGAVDHIVQSTSVGQQQMEQLRQVWCGPVAGNVAFGKADVAGLECCRKGLPVVQLQAHMWSLTIANSLHAAVRQLKRQ